MSIYEALQFVAKITTELVLVAVLKKGGLAAYIDCCELGFIRKLSMEVERS